MEFTEFLAKFLEVVSGLAAQWPTLIVTMALIPVVVDLLKWGSVHIGFPPNFDGYSKFVVFGFNLAAFAFYGVLVWTGLGYGTVEPIASAIAVILSALLGLLGGFGSALARKFTPAAAQFHYSR